LPREVSPIAFVSANLYLKFHPHSIFAQFPKRRSVNRERDNADQPNSGRISSKRDVRMRCRYRYLSSEILSSPLHCQPVKERNKRVTLIRLRKDSEGAGLPFRVESPADGIGESVRRMHVDGADFAPDIAPDFEKGVLEDVGMREYAREPVAVTVAPSKNRFQEGKIAGKCCKIRSLWP
jgi:hypothetical protein